jgi:hypothetical protein
MNKINQPKKPQKSVAPLRPLASTCIFTLVYTHVVQMYILHTHTHFTDHTYTLLRRHEKGLVSLYVSLTFAQNITFPSLWSFPFFLSLGSILFCSFPSLHSSQERNLPVFSEEYTGYQESCERVLRVKKSNIPTPRFSPPEGNTINVGLRVLGGSCVHVTLLPPNLTYLIPPTPRTSSSGRW